MKVKQFFWIINIYFEKIFYNTIFIVIFVNLSLNLDNLDFSTHLKSLTGNVSDIAHPCKFFASKYARYYDVMSLS